MRVSVVVPCYRSEGTIATLVARLESSLATLIAEGMLDDYEVLLVVDGSPDRVAEAAFSLRERNESIRVLELVRNFGQHNALVAGIRAASNETVVTLDDDLQHRPEEIHKLLRVLVDQSADLVYAVPEVEEHGFARSAVSRLVKASLALVGVPNAKYVGAFRAFRTELREGFTAVADPQVNLDVLLSWVTTRVSSVQVRMDRRPGGRSSYNLRALIRHTMNMVVGYGVLPLRFATWLGFACGVLGLVLLAIDLIQFFTNVNTVPGYTSIVAMISLFAGAQMITIGIIGEYLSRQHFRSMQRPMYVLRAAKEDD